MRGQNFGGIGEIFDDTGVWFEVPGAEEDAEDFGVIAVDGSHQRPIGDPPCACKIGRGGGVGAGCEEDAECLFYKIPGIDPQKSYTNK